MIYATVNMQIKDKECVCDKQILLYRGDKNVQIRFVLQGNKFMVLENTYAQMIIKRPSAVSLFSEVSPIQNDTVILTISEEMIDEFTEIGEYQFQIRLYDDNMNARATLPPCNSCLFIERPIAVENESIVGYARVNNSIVMAEPYASEEEVFDYDNEYIKTDWVDGDIISDVRMNKIEEALYQINKRAASGGTSATSAYISTSLSENAMVGTGEDFDLTIDFTSPNIGHGTLKVFVNDKEALSTRVEQGESTTPIPYSKFAKGSNTIVVYVVDRVGVMSNSLTFYVRYGGTELESTFDPYSSYEHGSTIRYYFTPSALDTSKDLYFYMTVDGAQQQPVICKSDERSYFTFSNSLSVGAHKCEAYVTDGESESNKHVFNLVIIDETSIVVATDTYTSTVEEGEQVSIDYKVYSKHQTSFIVKIYVDNTLVNTGTCGLAMNYYKTSSLKEGVHTIKIEAWSNDETVHNYCISEVEITPSLFEMYQPVNAGSTFIATAQNRSNADENRDKWIGVNQDGESVVATLQEFMFDTNDGWGDDLLTLNGTANVIIPIQPLANNALYGFTLDVTFRSRQIGVPEAEVLTLWDYEKDCGIKITSEELILKSAEGHVCDLYFSDNEMVNAMFVIDRDEKMAKIYLNGVMCEAFALSDYENNGIKYLEDFAIDSEIHINKFGGYCQIQDIRIYEVALGTNEILNNFIATKKTKSEQQYLEEFQKGDMLPTLTIYCDFSGLGKDDKKPCNIVYNSPDELLYGKSFTLEHKTSQLQYQGTSSMAYPIKNYRLNLRDKDGEKWKYNPFSSGQPEARFTLKADFMASGHWQNTGLAKWINDNLYHYDPKDEKSMNPAKWYDLQHGVPMTAHRESINGFPCRLILINDGETPLNEGQYEPTPGNTKDMGIFNFNNDKDNTDTLGFDEDIFPHCASYEVTANSDTSAGAFMSYDGDDPEGEVEYFKQSFELRFPDADDVGENYGYLGIEGVDGTGLKRVIDWVDNCTDEEFVRDFEQYFQKQYTLRYYILVIVLGMVDNLGKNMMLDTFDHKVWMPRFYDMDTICSYDNTGQIKFDVDIEMEQGYWNTSASRLWTRIRDLMHDELVEIYKDMRANGMSYESFMSYFYDQQIAKIPQKYYNMDADVKYLPFADAYIGKAHGDGYEHLKRWLKKRLIFTDTLYDYQPSYINDVLTIRANTTEEMTIEIETYTPLYQHVSWYNGQMDKKKIDGKISVTFNGRAQAATDQEVLIYGGSNIKSIKGISSCNPSQLLIGAATRLVELDAKNCTLLSDINSNGANLLPHTYLNKVDLSGCTALPGTLNIQNSPLLRYIDVSGSSITGINMPSTAKNIEYMKFMNCLGLTNANLSNLYMPRLTSCASMFEGCSNLTSLNLSNWNIPKVASTNNMFRNCSSLTSLDVSEWVTSSVTKMDSMFHDCAALTSLDVSGWDTSNVDNIGSTFNNCRALTSLDLSGWDVSSVTNMYATFRNCSSLISLDVSGWDASSVTNMSFMFDGCSVLTSLDVSDWVIKNVTHAPSMFQNCTALTSLDLSGWDVSNVIDINRMFNGCSSLTSLDVSGWDVSCIGDTLYMFAKCSALTTLTANNMTHTNPKLFTDAINNGIITELIAENWKFNGENVSLADLFKDNVTIQNLNLKGWDTSSVTSMYAMFYNCSDLTSLDVSEWDTSSVISMNTMFAYCRALTSLDVSEWDVSSVASMSSMFYNCTTLTSLDVSGWDTSSVTNMTDIFHDCRALSSLDVSEWDVSSVANINSVFYDCKALTSLDLSGWDTSEATSMNYMFYGCSGLTSLDLSGWDTSKVTTAENIFYGCSKLTILIANNVTHTNPKLFTDAINNGIITELIAENWKFNGENVSLAELFRDNATIQNLNLKGWNTSSVTAMNHIFYNCTALTSLDLSGWNTKNVTNMYSMFNGCAALTSLDVSEWDTSSVTSMYAMFQNCTALTSLDVSEWDTSSVTSMSTMFRGCSSLTSLDVSGWVTSNVTDMGAMFSSCAALTSLDLSGWVTSSVTTMTHMFDNCSKLTSLDISEWDTSSVMSLDNMFYGCSALTSLDVSEWDTSSVKSLYRVFNTCTNLTSLNLSGWDTSSVTSTDNVFTNTNKLTLVKMNNCTAETIELILPLLPNTPADIVTPTVRGDVAIDETKLVYNWIYDVLSEMTIMRYISTDSTVVPSFDTDFTSGDFSVIVQDKDGNYEITINRTSDKYPTTFTLQNAGVLDVNFLEFDKTLNSLNASFQNCTNLTHINANLLDVSSVTDMNNMFNGCSALTSLDLSNWNVSKVTNMAHLFRACSSLTSLDLSGWVTSSVTNMYNMFRNCSALTSLDLSGWDTKKVTNMSYMFNGCSALESLDVSGWDTSSVTNMIYMFQSCSSLTSLDVSNWVTSSVTDIGSMFYNCSSLTSLDVSEWVTSKVTNMGHLFRGCSSLTSLDLSGWVTSSVTTMTYMFNGCTSLTSLDISGWDTSKVTTMVNMFNACTSLLTVDISGWDVSSVTTMTNMFQNCSKLNSLTCNNMTHTNPILFTDAINNKYITELIAENWKFNGESFSLAVLFRDNATIQNLDLKGWDTSKVTGMHYMFQNCSALTSLDVSGWVTSSVTSMRDTFNNCRALTSLDLSNWNVSKVTTTLGMFQNCSALTSLDVSGWNPSSVTATNNMFNGCSKLTSLDLSGWITSSVTSMNNMFYNCSALQELRIDNWLVNDITQTAISSLPAGNDERNVIYATAAFAVPSGWTLINNAAKTMILPSDELTELTDEEILALTEDGWTIG